MPTKVHALRFRKLEFFQNSSRDSDNRFGNPSPGLSIPTSLLPATCPLEQGLTNASTIPITQLVTFLVVRPLGREENAPLLSKW